MLHKCLSEYLKAEISPNEFGLLAMAISNRRDVNLPSIIGSPLTSTENTPALSSFIFYRPPKFDQICEHLIDLLQGDRVKCRSTIDFITKVVNQKFIKRLSKNYKPYKDITIEKLHIKLLILLIETNPQHYVSLLLISMQNLEFDPVVMFYLKNATDPSYTRCYKDLLLAMNSIKYALKDFFFSLNSLYHSEDGSFQNFRREGFMKQAFLMKAFYCLLDFIASNYEIGYLFEIKEFRLICAIIFRDRQLTSTRRFFNQEFSSREILFGLIKTVSPEYSHDALLCVAENLFLEIIDKENKISCFLFTKIYKGLSLSHLISELKSDSNDIGILNISVWELKRPCQREFDKKLSVLHSLITSEKTEAEELIILKRNLSAFTDYKVNNFGRKASCLFSLAQSFFSNLKEITVIRFEAVSLLNTNPFGNSDYGAASSFGLYEKKKTDRIFPVEGSATQKRLYRKAKSLCIKNSYMMLQNIEYTANILLGLFYSEFSEEGVVEFYEDQRYSQIRDDYFKNRITISFTDFH
jgi:hypothetical protein